MYNFSLPIKQTSVDDHGINSGAAVSLQLSIISAHEKQAPEIWIATRLNHDSVCFLQSGHIGICMDSLA